MCELFALSSNVPVAINFAFTGFSSRGGRSGPHADGFGVAFHEGAVCRAFIDEGRACDAALGDFLRRHPYRARIALAHIRKATQGPVQLANCHPFVREWQGRHWSFCHNGDLQDFHPCLSGPFQPIGSTDSERAFCWILQTLRRRFGHSRTAPGWRQLAPVLAELAAHIGRHGRFNFLLSDGQALYAHCATQLHSLRLAHPFSTVHLVDEDLSLDLSTAHKADERMTLVATQPLTRQADWQAFNPGELRVFVGGVTVWQGGTCQPPLRSQPEPAERADLPV